MILKFAVLLFLSVILLNLNMALQKAKDNGDIYIKTEKEFLEAHTTESPQQLENDTKVFKRSAVADNESVYTVCNNSFSIPMGEFFSRSRSCENVKL